MGTRKDQQVRPLCGNGPSSVEHEAQDLKPTPLWNAYHQRIRWGIRFPHYYRKELNW